MSGICGYVGAGSQGDLEAMLGAIPYRGDRVDTQVLPGLGLGYRWWGGRPGKSPGIHRGSDGRLVACAGTLAPSVFSPAAHLAVLLGSSDFFSGSSDPASGSSDFFNGSVEIDPASDSSDLSTLDGAFAAALWDPRTRSLTLLRDPFGVRSLYYIEHRGTFYFASELKQLLALPQLPVELDHTAIHKYLTFSFVPGEAVPIRGVRRLLPGQLLVRGPEGMRSLPWFTLKEAIDPGLEDQGAAVRRIQRVATEAVQRRLNCLQAAAWQLHGVMGVVYGAAAPGDDVVQCVLASTIEASAVVLKLAPTPLRMWFEQPAGPSGLL